MNRSARMWTAKAKAYRRLAWRSLLIQRFAECHEANRLACACELLAAQAAAEPRRGNLLARLWRAFVAWVFGDPE